MNRPLSRAATVLMLLALLPFGAHPQSFLNLTTLGDSIISAVQAEKANWKYEPVSAIEGSADVILQQWTLDSQSVRIAVVSHHSAEEASKQMAALIANNRGQRVNEGPGDDTVSWGKNTISFRRRNFTVDISAVNTNSTLDVAEFSNRADDERKLCKQFAKIVAEAMKDNR